MKFDQVAVLCVKISHIRRCSLLFSCDSFIVVFRSERIETILIMPQQISVYVTYDTSLGPGGLRGPHYKSGNKHAHYSTLSKFKVRTIKLDFWEVLAETTAMGHYNKLRI